MSPSTPTIPTQQSPFGHLIFPFSNINPIQLLLESILSRNKPRLEDLVREFKKSMSEKEEVMFSKLIEITPDKPSEEAYQEALKQLYLLFTEEFSENINAIANTAINLEMTPPEFEEELMNLMLPELLKLKANIDETSELLLEKALTSQISDKDLKEIDVLDKFLFLESNILGIILETRSLEIAGQLSPYFILLMFRLLKILQENKPLSELLEDIKIVAKKIKEVHPTPTAVDDYLIDDLIEQDTPIL